MTTAYTNCLLFDGTSDETQEGATIVVDGTKIAAVLPQGQPHNADEEVDCKGRFVMPGMINAHAHHFSTGKPTSALVKGFKQRALLALEHTPAGEAILEQMCVKTLRTAMYSGVTTERGTGDMLGQDLDVRDRIASGRLVGPRFITSGAAITTPYGHGAGIFADEAIEVADLAALVDKRAEAGADFIKICVTSGILETSEQDGCGVLRMNRQQVEAVCERAAEHGLKVSSHAEGPEGMEVSILAGVDYIEHGAPIADESLIEKILESGTAVITTLGSALPLAALDETQSKLDDVARHNAGVTLQRNVECARQCLEHGIPMGIGSGAGYPFITHYDLWHEVLIYQTALHVTEADALRAITQNNARVLGIDDVTGTIEAGKDADFIILDTNPLEDLHRLRDVREVIVRGARQNDAKPQLASYRDLDVDSIIDPLYYLGDPLDEWHPDN